MNRKFLFLVLSAAVTWNLPSEEVIWFVNEFAPYTVLEGPERNTGVVQILMEELSRELPEYTFVPTLANISRVTDAFKSGKNSIYGTYRKTPERQAFTFYSLPYLIYQSAGVMVHESFRRSWLGFIQEDSFNLVKALEADNFRIAVINDVSLGTWIDGPAAAAGESKVMRVTLSPENVQDSRMFLLAMNRISGVPGYEESLRLDVRKAGLNLEDFHFYPVAGAPAYQQMSLAVPKTPWGQKFLERVNPVLVKLRPLMAAEYAKWISPASRDRYGRQQFSP